MRPKPPGIFPRPPLGETSGKMKQFATWFTHGVAGGAKLRGAIYQARSGAEVLAQVDAFFTAQIANGAEPDAAPEDAVGTEFPEEMLECGS